MFSGRSGLLANLEVALCLTLVRQVMDVQCDKSIDFDFSDKSNEPATAVKEQDFLPSRVLE